MQRGLVVVLLSAGCAPLELDAPVERAWVVYDPSGGDVPLPNDLLLDADAGRLSLPTDDPSLSPADAELRGWLNELPGWPTTFPVSATFSEPVDPTTVTPDTVQVWSWGAPPVRVAGVDVAVDEDGTRLTVSPPLDGWGTGGRYAVVVRGGRDGVRTRDGEVVGPDAAMWYLRQAEPLDDPAHQRAFPGATREERLASAARLEAVRTTLDGWVEPIGLPRDELSALWTFTVTPRTELAMDRASQRIPLPFNLLIDPETGLVELTAAPWDTRLEADAKLVANTFRGFGLSADPFFETTLGLDPATVSSDTVQLWDVTTAPVRVPSRVRVMRDDGDEGCQAPPYARDCTHVFVVLPPDQIPLDPNHTYAVVVTDALKDRDGRSVDLMPLGRFLLSGSPVLVDGKSQLSGVSDVDARRLERVRGELGPVLDVVGRKRVSAAWTFTTMDPLPGVVSSANRADELGLSSPPVVEWRRPASSLLDTDAIGDLFPGALNPGPAVYIGRTSGVKHVVSGSILVPDYLDPVTRRARPEPTLTPVKFWAAVPEGYSAQRKLPVVIFGHAIVTDRRFLLTVASEFMSRGFVVVGIDFPYHGERLACVEASLVAVPNFLPPTLQQVTGFTDELIWFPPCESGDAASCSPTGQCLDARGNVEPFSSFPIMDMYPVSGAAFLDVLDLPYIPDHFHQALIDLSALKRSLDTEDWERALQQRIDPEATVFVGQSLGSIIGSVWVAGRDDIERAVFNVPGSNLVDLFRNSVYFQPQIEQAFVDMAIPEGSYEQARLLSVASWLIDSVDPHSVARVYRDREFPGLIQIDRVNDTTGDLIIPNPTTENLARVSGMTMKSYSSVLHADLIVPVIGDAMLSDAGAWLGSVPQ